MAWMYKNKSTGEWEKGYPHGQYRIDRNGDHIGIFDTFYWFKIFMWKLRGKRVEYQYIPTKGPATLRVGTEVKDI